MAEDDKKSFWSSLPGILTGLAALLTAAGALIYHQQTTSNSKPEPPRHESSTKDTRPEPPKNPLAPPEGFEERASYDGNCSKPPEGSGCIHFRDGYQWLVRDEIEPQQKEYGTWEHHEKVEVTGKHGRYEHILGTDYVKKVER